MKCQVLVDWLNFSVKNVTDPQVIIRDFLGMDHALFQDPGYGWMGYQKLLEFSNIRVAYEPRENTYFHDMGICVSMTGNGCRAFESMSRLKLSSPDKQGMESSAFSVLFQTLASNPDCNVSRLDIACDDREDYLDMEEIISRTQRNELNSRMAKRSVITSWDGVSRNGSTVYIGSPSSDFRIRIYDKALEQGEPGHWVRVELSLKAENAGAFVSELTNSETVGKLAAQVLNDKLSFIERDDTNISRCTVCDWWRRFVDELESVHLVSREVIQHCVEHINDWLEHQIAPSLAIIMKTMGFGRLFEMIHEVDAQQRLSNKQLTVIQDYNSLRLARAVG